MKRHPPGLVSAAQGNDEAAVPQRSVRIGRGGTYATRFGDVVVRGPKPTEEANAHHAAVSTQALRRGIGKVVTPGVRITRRKDVPLYFVDPDTPGMYLRVLNGLQQKGVLEAGRFKVVD